MFIAKYQTGSSLFLENCNDIDYVYFYSEVKEKKMALIRNRDHSVDNHYHCFNGIPQIFLGCYCYPFMKLIEGTEILELKSFNILEHKSEYQEIVKKYAPNMLDSDKRWYHILVSYFMFKNDSLELTPEQLVRVQSVHDNGITAELRSKLEGYFKCQ